MEVKTTFTIIQTSSNVIKTQNFISLYSGSDKDVIMEILETIRDTKLVTLQKRYAFQG